MPPLRDIIQKYGLTARKGLGQHFIHDLNLTARIAHTAGDINNGTVIEVGPGPGGLTRALLQTGAHVIAIEKDGRCIDALSEIMEVFPGQLEIIQEDALKIDTCSLGNMPRRVISNLPYNIGTELVLRWLDRPDAFTSLTVMVQKEVAARLAAEPGSRTYGRLSVFAGWRWRIKLAFDVNPQAFTPPPSVDSTVVHMTPLNDPIAMVDANLLAQVTAAAFGQRRKMLRSSLKSIGDASALCTTAGLDPTWRAEQVPVSGFCALARALEQTNEHAD
ncbi:MAG: 16S rRNA (adenine(1518)-N(6)/adenine(1519)-N(6))-dimethyltransferase RsmA [Rhodospirillaceae bacterium]